MSEVVQKSNYKFKPAGINESQYMMKVLRGEITEISRVNLLFLRNWKAIVDDDLFFEED